MSRDHDQLSALVDGELDHETRDQLLAHVAGCPDCRAIVEDERAMKSMLGGLAPPEPSADLLARARAIGTPGLGQEPPVGLASTAGRSGRDGFGSGGYAGVPAPRFGGFPTYRGAGGRSPLAGAAVAAALPQPDRRNSRLRYAAAGALSAAGVCFAMTFALVANADPAPEATIAPPAQGAPASEDAASGHAADVVIPLSDPAEVSSSLVQENLAGVPTSSATP